MYVYHWREKSAVRFYYRLRALCDSINGCAVYFVTNNLSSCALAPREPPAANAGLFRKTDGMRTNFKFAALVLLASSVTAAADGAGGMKDRTAAAVSPNWDVAFGGYTASDYIFRGITQSAHWPSVSGYTELRYSPLKDVQLYAGSSTESIDYPNRAAAEADFYGGVRPTFDKLSLDFGFWYYWYPGGRQFSGGTVPGLNPNCTNGFVTPAGACNVYEADLSFWEVYGKATYTVNDTVTLGANAYYSPSWLAEGADGPGRKAR